MKKILFAAVLLLPIFLSAQTAKIKIDIDRTIGEIDPKIYGVFMEPIQFSGRRMGLPDSVKCTFPPHSFTQIKLGVK